MTGACKAKLETVAARLEIEVVPHSLWHDQVDYLSLSRVPLVKVIREVTLVSVQLCPCPAVDADDILLVPVVRVSGQLLVLRDPPQQVQSLFVSVASRKRLPEPCHL